MKFAIYDFEMTLPNDFRVTVDKKSGYESGYINLASPAGAALNFVWENLDKHKSQFASVDAFVENSFNIMKKNKNVKEFNSKKDFLKSEMEHEYLPHEFSYTFKQPLSKGVSKKIIGLAMYDNHSNRFAIVYAQLNLDNAPKDEGSIKQMINSFECKCSGSSSA